MSDNGDTFLNSVEEDYDDEPLTIESQDTGNTDQPVTRPSSADSNTLVKPAAESDALAEHFNQYEDVVDAIIDPQEDTETVGGNSFITKSGMRKLATAFNLSVDTQYENRFIEGGVLKYKVKAVATAPNGRSSTGVGICGSMESNFMRTVAKSKQNKSHGKEQAVRPEEIHFVDGKWRELLPPNEVDEHSILATAATRAKNRAISDMVGSGEVSSEEISKEDILD